MFPEVQKKDFASCAFTTGKVTAQVGYSFRVVQLGLMFKLSSSSSASTDSEFWPKLRSRYPACSLSSKELSAARYNLVRKWVRRGSYADFGRFLTLKWISENLICTKFWQAQVKTQRFGFPAEIPQEIARKISDSATQEMHNGSITFLYLAFSRVFRIHHKNGFEPIRRNSGHLTLIFKLP